MNQMAKYHQNIYKLTFPEKYNGNPTNIIYRSSWEKKFMEWCEYSPSVLKWKSEEVVIPYRCATDGRIRRYFVDFQIDVITKSGNAKTYLVEVKPHKETAPPVYPGRQTKRYLTETMTYMKNMSKWEAAEQYCSQRGWEFKIITEYELGLKKHKKK